MNIGIVGTGAVDSPLARNLAAAGHNVKSDQYPPVCRADRKSAVSWREPRHT